MRNKVNIKFTYTTAAKKPTFSMYNKNIWRLFHLFRFRVLCGTELIFSVSFSRPVVFQPWTRSGVFGWCINPNSVKFFFFIFFLLKVEKKNKWEDIEDNLWILCQCYWVIKTVYNYKDIFEVNDLFVTD